MAAGLRRGRRARLAKRRGDGRGAVCRAGKAVGHQGEARAQGGEAAGLWRGGARRTPAPPRWVEVRSAGGGCLWGLLSR